jgi:hypothetical protein
MSNKNFCFRLCLIAMVLIICRVSGAVDHIHFGSTHNPLNGLTVSWRTTASSSSIRWGYTASYEQGEFDGVQRSDYSGNLFDYAFPVVNPSSTIHYSIYDGAWTGDQTFHTAQDTNLTSFTFCAGGDSRSNMTGWKTMADHLGAKTDINFLLHDGDRLNSGSSTSDWTDWYSYGDNYIKNILTYSSGGNHEYGSIYHNQFVLPGNEKWYSFDYGNAIFICLLSQDPSSTTQYNWLVQTLQNTDKTWKIVWFHKPFYVQVAHSNEMDAYFPTWWQAFDDYGVDVIINGHTHFYMRSVPINRNISTNSPVDEYGSYSDQGRLQVVSGNMGAQSYDGSPNNSTYSNWYVETCWWANHYLKFSVNGSILHMDALDWNDVLFDSVTIVKGPPGPDNDPPYFISLAPQGTVYEDVISLQVQTNEPAYLRWSMNDEPYNAMANQFTVGEGSRHHSVNVNGTHGTAYTYYVRAIDDSGNATDTSGVISFSVDTTCIQANWTERIYDDRTWMSGAAELGYGDGNEVTGIDRVYAAYFRHIFNVTDPGSISSLSFDLEYDDGAVVYINGNEVERIGMPSGDITYNTWASVGHEGGSFVNFDITSDIDKLNQGENVIAVEVHQGNSGSSDISFNLGLLAGVQTLVPRGAVWSYYDKGDGPAEMNTCPGPVVMHGTNMDSGVRGLEVYPNPFNPEVNIKLHAPGFDMARKVSLRLFNIHGTQVNEWNISPARLAKGIKWYSRNLPSGVYVLKVSAGQNQYIAKMLLQR